MDINYTKFDAANQHFLYTASMSTAPLRRRHRGTNIIINALARILLFSFGHGFIRVFIVFGSIFVVLFFTTVLVVVRDLPTPTTISQNTRYSTTLLDRNDKVIYQVFENKNIIPVEIKKLPQHVIQATIAIEDKNFYNHGGFSVVSIFRAALRNLIFRRSEGGSTLTQQLIKNTLLSSEKTYMRKLKEFILAIELERRYSKDEILEMYLNQIPYGGTYYGIESASQNYFDKNAQDLTVLEAAVLAGFPQSPSKYSPFIGERFAYIDRTKDVLRRMREDKYITRVQEKKLVEQLPKVRFSRDRAKVPAAHFVFYIKDQLDKLFSDDALYRKGLVIKTTLDLDMQKETEKIVADEIEKSKGLDIENGAVVIMEPHSGAIISMVGSSDYSNERFGKFNAALGYRQPGSTLKPFAYAFAFEKNFTPASVLMDVPTEFATGKELPDEKKYIPENYDGKYNGPVQLRFALGNSLNVPAVKLLSLVGLEPFLEKAYKAGLTTMQPTQKNLSRFGLSVTLGGGEVRLLDLVTAYTALAAEGRASAPYAIVDVRDYRGKLLYKPPKAQKAQVFTPEAAFLVSHILSDNNARLSTFGANSYLNIPGRTVAAKTGTTDDKRDNWTVGYTKDLVVGVWVGNNDNSKMNQTLASGVSGAAPIWYRTFQHAFKKGYKDGITDKPKNVEAFEVDALFGGIPKDGSSKRTEYFIKGKEPKSVSAFYKKLKISKATNKLANELEVASGGYEEKDFYVVVEQDPVSQDDKNRWQEAIHKWASEQSDEKWKGPTEISDSNAEDIAIDLKKPGDMAVLTSTEVEILARAVSLQPIKSFKLYIKKTADNSEVLKKDTKDAVIDEKISLENNEVYILRFVAVNEKDKTVEKSVRVGINTDPQPTPTPTATPTPPPIPTATTPVVPPSAD